jgi:hypothetical protein
MTALRFTLLSEGSSDRALIPILLWALRQHSLRTFQAQWADLRGLRQPLRGLTRRLDATLQLYPCELLFVHRDADLAGLDARVREIEVAVQSLGGKPDPPLVCVIPVRALEAWFLFDEGAIRRAADNPRGSVQLDLPQASEIETIPRPKEVLLDLLRTASGLSTRRRRGMRWHKQIHRIAELTADFSPLRQLSAFQAFEDNLRDLLASHGW